MTDDSATLRAMAEKALELCDEAEKYFINPFNVSTRLHNHMRVLANTLLVSQSSWAKEKAELERQLAEADRTIWHDHAIKTPDDAPDHYDLYEQRIVEAIERHTSRPVTAKE